MKFHFFHLMPYQDIDPDFLETNKSSWINLPNTYYYPKKGAKLYHRYLDELELADELGFDGVCVNEHHQTAYGMMPSPNVLAGALSRRWPKGVPFRTGVTPWSFRVRDSGKNRLKLKASTRFLQQPVLIGVSPVVPCVWP